MRPEEHQGNISDVCTTLLYIDMQSGWYAMYKIHWENC